MDFNLFSQSNGRSSVASVQVASVPLVSTAPFDWMKFGCDAMKESVRLYSETDAWVICSRDCDSVEFAVPIKLALGAAWSMLDSVYTTTLTDCPREFIVRPDEWRQHVELGEFPKRGLFIYVVVTNEWVELVPESGSPVYDAADGYSSLWKVRGKVVKPCFVWGPI